jgi:hypothetical protein
MAAIERARTVPARNPAGVFLFIVKNRKWDFLSDGHYHAANDRLKQFLYPPLPRAASLGGLATFAAPVIEKPRLSRDALLVQVVRNELARKGLRADLFPVLRAHAGWDRDRFNAALAELEPAGQSPAAVAVR